MATGSFTTSGSFGSHWHGDVYGSVNSQNAAANQSSIHVDLQIRADSSAYSVDANTSYNVRVNGGQIASGSRTINFTGPGPVDLISGNTTVTHDANGNWSGSVGGGLSCDYSGVGSGSGDYGFSVPRLPLAPTINSLGVNSIKPSSAIITSSVSSFGHGTSVGVNVYYKLSTDGSYTYAGSNANQTITGLKAGKTYNYYVSWFNNNGDTATSGVQSFTTLSIPGAIAVLLGLM